MTVPVVLISTGGTIASRTTDAGAVPVLTATELLAGHPAPESVEVHPVELMSVDSSALRVVDQVSIVRAIEDALTDPDVAGVVVTHGTDTMEETAFLADLYAHDPRPVIFTGAQRPADADDADGPTNLAAALTAATDTGNRGRGVQLALGGHLRPVRGTFKASTTATDPFDAVHDGLGRPLLSGPVPPGAPARVDAFTLYPGVSPGLIAAAVAQNAAGIVVAATGSGNTHPDITAQVSLAVQRGVIVVVTTRVPFGAVEPTYGGGGGAVDLERAGAIISGWLRAPQARVALLALLSAGADRDVVADFFARSGPS